MGDVPRAQHSAAGRSGRARRARSAPALTILGTLAFALGACQTSPPPAALTDPKEILAAAITTTASAKTVRIDGSADGTVQLPVVGFDAPSAVELTGTTFSADLDLAGGDARVTFSAPGLLGLTGEAIALDGTSYVKTTLTGSLYHAHAIGADVPAPSNGSQATFLKGVTDLLANPALQPIKGEDVECGGSSCYRVELTLSKADLSALGLERLEAPAGLPIPFALAAVIPTPLEMTVLVARDTTRLSGLTAKVDQGTGGAAALDLTFSKWDEAVSISAPPPDQVAPGG